MRSFQFSRLVATLTTSALCIALLGVQNNATVPEVVQNASAKALSYVARFRESHSLEYLAAAIDALHGSVQPNTLTPANFVETRRTLARSWAIILKEVEASYDPTFNPNDPNNVPFLCVPPPAIVGATPCMAPNKISDPHVRAKYEKSIEENDRRKQRWDHYIAVKQLDDRAMTRLSMMLELFNEIAPDNIGPDAATLESIFRSAGVSSSRLGRIQSMIHMRDRR